MRGFFLTGTGTAVGKTWLGRGLSLAAGRERLRVVAVKPVETGCNSEPADAIALARACGDPSLADAPGLYRARAALSPYAATLAGEAPPPAPSALAERALALGAGADLLLVEGAGGLLVPLDRDHDMRDLARALALPCILVAPNALGVLSHVLAAVEAARDLPLAAVVLTGARDESAVMNPTILSERLDRLPVWVVCADGEDDDALASAAAPVLAGLLSGTTRWRQDR